MVPCSRRRRVRPTPAQAAYPPTGLARLRYLARRTSKFRNAFASVGTRQAASGLGFLGWEHLTHRLHDLSGVSAATQGGAANSCLCVSGQPADENSRYRSRRRSSASRAVSPGRQTTRSGCHSDPGHRLPEAVCRQANGLRCVTSPWSVHKLASIELLDHLDDSHATCKALTSLVRIALCRNDARLRRITEQDALSRTHLTAQPTRPPTPMIRSSSGVAFGSRAGRRTSSIGATTMRCSETRTERSRFYSATG